MKDERIEPSPLAGTLASEFPGHLFQVLNAGQAFVQVVRAFADRERNADRLEQAVANSDLLALCVATNDTRIDAGIAARRLAYRGATVNFS